METILTGRGRASGVFYEILEDARNVLSARYASAVDANDRAELEQTLKPAIRQFLTAGRRSVAGMTTEELTDRIYTEMAEYSILTKYLERDDVEEINVNAWNDIAVTYDDGEIRKTEETFFSPSHAEDILKRLLRHSGAVLDNSTPMAQGHLPGNKRVTALKTPLVDENVGVSASIRMLKPRRITPETLEKNGFATGEMLDFLTDCARYGVPFVIAGATSSGKTTLLNALLGRMPDRMRIFTIESGARELSLVREDENGHVRTNVVHTLSRPSDRKENDISQEDLVVASLRFNPDLIVVGEMRDEECYAAVESGLTGHTVVSTVHAASGPSAHTRIALLCQKRFPIPFRSSLDQAAEAFPVVAFARQSDDGVRRLTDLTECVRTGQMHGEAEREYRCLYSYGKDGKSNENGFVKRNPPSKELLDRLTRGGLPDERRAVYEKHEKRKTNAKGGEEN
ncbi:MAG: CpaF family protein [Clostridia bacterium]|nr:CpaF family protein [Clostridia bacterium]